MWLLTLIIPFSMFVLILSKTEVDKLQQVEEVLRQIHMWYVRGQMK